MFPVEIWEQIFLYIDPVTLTKLKIVCKLWKEIINKLLKQYDLWYEICDKEIPKNTWALLLESLYPTKSHNLLSVGDVELWISMYRWWTKSKKLIKYNTSMECVNPIPKFHYQENITCIASFDKTVAVGTSDGYIYFYNIENLNEKPIYIVDHMAFICELKFLKNDKQIIVVSSSISGHIKFWDLESKKLINKDRGKLLCTSNSCCYSVIYNTLIVQGCISRTFCDLPFEDTVSGLADDNKLSLYTQKGHFLSVQIPGNGRVIFKGYVKPPRMGIRHFYLFKNNIAACITGHGYLGLSVRGSRWKLYNILLILHGIPTTVLIYAHLLILGLDTGHVCIFYVEDFNLLDLYSIRPKRVILDTEPIISLVLSACFKEYLIAASSKRVHFINFV